MAQDETEFDKLLKETREWEARDRARHGSSAMREDEPVPVAPGRTRMPAANTALPSPTKQKPAPVAIPRLKGRSAGAWVWLLILLYFAFKFFTR